MNFQFDNFRIGCFLIIGSLFYWFIYPTSTLAYDHFVTPAPVKISATIGEPKLSLFGYSCANCLVYLQGQRVFEETSADRSGFFEFDKVLLPSPFLANSNSPELCLISIDSQQRTTFPTCLPPLPSSERSYHASIGPVLLPPTLSLSKGAFAPKEQVVASGQAIPNSTVNIYLANQKSSSLLGLVKSAHAYNLPHYQASADNRGSFEFNLPVSYSKWRVFAAADFKESPSPKSNSLTFRVLSPLGWLWEMIKQAIMIVFGFAFPYLWLIIIIIELAAIYLLVKKKRHPRGGQKSCDKLKTKR